MFHQRPHPITKSLTLSTLGFLASLVSLPAQAPSNPGEGSASSRRAVISHPCQAPCGPWDERSAAHLMRRAGFSVSSQELAAVVDQGFDATLDELLNYEQVDDSEMQAGLEAEDYQLTVVADSGRLRPQAANMRRWWSYRMVNSRRQLLEKLTYFWHDHFATSVATVREVSPDGQPTMMIQNELLRTHALGNFKTLVEEIAKDPAMLVWLDNRSNVKEQPNENWARELLELFTMGVDKYTDTDVKEAARAFTGWGLDRETGAFRFYPERHDNGIKTFLSVSGDLDGDDIIDIIFGRPETAEFIVRKLFEFFVYAGPAEEVIEELAEIFRQNDHEIRPLMAAILTHPEFFADQSYRGHIKSPVELVVGTFRELGIPDPYYIPPVMTEMGQDLFEPPDVGGWTTDIGWINTSSLLGRYNFFNLLVTLRGPNEILDIDRIVQENGLTTSLDVAEYFVDTFVQGDVSTDTLYVLEEYLRTDEDGQLVEFDITDPVTLDKKVRGMAYLTMVLPVYQLN